MAEGVERLFQATRAEADHRRTVECEVKGGKVVKLKVTPESRRENVEACDPFPPRRNV